MTKSKDEANTEDFEQSLVNGLAKEMLNEQRRNRRWGVFFKSLFALYIFTFFIIYIVQNTNLLEFGSEEHTALIDISGVISATSEARADYVVTGLRKAFEDEQTKGVILRINSPGGSPVQAGYINDEIYRLKSIHPEIPVYAVISDICASGGYYIATAADKIYADKASIVGSIGVIMSGFGFVDAIDKLGVERRVLHAGDSKSFMDPFVPLKVEEEQHVQGLLNQIHQQFIDVVEKGRGDRLTDNDQLYSGLFWSGEASVELGLIDELGSSSKVARDVIGVEHIVNFTRQQNFLDRFAKQIGASVLGGLNESLRLE